MPQLFGRHEILTSVDSITRENVVSVLDKAIAIHVVNEAEIDYLYRYMRGEQPILERTKKIRPEICNKIVENHASEIAQFTSGYFMGEPVTYVRRGDREGASDDVNLLNDYMFFEDKSSHDKDLATWMAICGVGYRMVLPDETVNPNDEDESPFELDTVDPRTTFVVYHSGFGHKRMMGVRKIYKQLSVYDYKVQYAVYTENMYWLIEDAQIIEEKSHTLGDIPIFEYRLNMTMMGSFEPAIPLLDGINTIMSNRVDGVEQFVQSFLKFKNCEVDDDAVQKLAELGAIVIKSQPGLDSDVTIVAQELNQQQTQTLVDYLYEQILVICGLPTTTKGGASTSDTGAAVLLRDGWQQCQSRARDSELLFKKSEKQFLKLVLRLIREKMDFKLSLREVECKFTRRQHDNLLTKAQTLQIMLEAGLNPEVAIATCGLFNDPMDVAMQSADWLKKWDYHEPIPLQVATAPADDTADEEDDSNADEESENKDSESDVKKDE